MHIASFVEDLCVYLRFNIKAQETLIQLVKISLGHKVNIFEFLSQFFSVVWSIKICPSDKVLLGST